MSLLKVFHPTYCPTDRYFRHDLHVELTGTDISLRKEVGVLEIKRKYLLVVIRQVSFEVNCQYANLTGHSAPSERCTC